MSKYPLIGTAAALVVAFGVASAQTTAPAPQAPLTQGISSVDRNLERDPDNKGLQTASDRLKANQERLEEQRPTRPDFAQRPAGFERPQGPMRGGR